MTDFYAHFTSMLPDGVFQQSQVDEAVALWELYFTRFGIDESRKIQEFDGLIQVRVAAGSISIVAPTNKEAGINWR